MIQGAYLRIMAARKTELIYNVLAGYLGREPFEIELNNLQLFKATRRVWDTEDLFFGNVYLGWIKTTFNENTITFDFFPT